MTAYLVLGIAGLVVLALALVLGDLLHGVLGGIPGDWFSTEVLGGFVSAFGFAGAAATGAGAPGGLAALVGVGAGVVVGLLAAWLTRLVRGGATDDTPSSSDAIGRDAVVVSTIPLDGLGTIRVRVGGHTVRLHARADLPLETGTEVQVTGVLSPTAVTVAPTWSSLPPSSGSS